MNTARYLVTDSCDSNLDNNNYRTLSSACGFVTMKEDLVDYIEVFDVFYKT